MLPYPVWCKRNMDYNVRINTEIIVANFYSFFTAI